MNENFTPLKVNAMRNPTLTEYLRIQSFPTVVLADPEGKILATLEGFMEAPRFQDHLQRAIATLSNPEWMTRDYQAASKAIADSDYSRALALIGSIVEDGKNRPVQVKARQLMQEIERLAEQRLVQAKKDQDQGKQAEAMEKIADLMKRFPGTHASARRRGHGEEDHQHARPEGEAATEPGSRAARPGRARTSSSQHYLWCLDRCDNLINNYFDLPRRGRGACNSPTRSRATPSGCAGLRFARRASRAALSVAGGDVSEEGPAAASDGVSGARDPDIARLAAGGSGPVRLDQIQGRPSQQVKFKTPADRRRRP